MERSSVSKAAAHFAAGRYKSAYSIYRELGNQLGESFFAANLILCEKRIKRELSSRVGSSFKKLRVAAIMDEFTHHSYEPECEILPLKTVEATADLEKFGPDLLFVESAWRGKDNSWDRKIANLSAELKSILQWCRENCVPTVFWNKEDPVHFETFLTTAQAFDLVFTTDIDCIARYKSALGHDRVYLLPFACQPTVHNPIELYSRKDAFCFAGAYYVKYPERTADLSSYIADLPKFKPVEIFDRNFGKDDINYQFPTEYQPYIVGTLPFAEIDRAYKGYSYAINLNSIKQSQSMFARRVYELLASNTLTVSNFSRGVRLLFGDLVVTSDSGNEIVRRLTSIDSAANEKLRLSGLRKVMREHTYQHRLSYVVQKALGLHLQTDTPPIVVLAQPTSQSELAKALTMFEQQSYERKRLLLVTEEPETTLPDTEALRNITVLRSNQVDSTLLDNLTQSEEWVAYFHASDYYGPNYLLDMALATKYSEDHAIGKAAHFISDGDTVSLVNKQARYKKKQSLNLRACMVHTSFFSEATVLSELLGRLANGLPEVIGLSIDPYNYCEGLHFREDVDRWRAVIDDRKWNEGLSISQLLLKAESIEAAEFDEMNLPQWTSRQLFELCGRSNARKVNFSFGENSFRILSQLPDGKHEYFYSSKDLSIKEFPNSTVWQCHLETTPGLDLQYVFQFLDERRNKISHSILRANKNHNLDIPPGSKFIRCGWRVSGSGTTTVSRLIWAHRTLDPAEILGLSEHLILTNHYPSYADLYRNGFVHSRAKAYQNRGKKIDVFRFKAESSISYHEYNDLDVVTGSAEALKRALSSGRYKSILVHFLSPEMWSVLSEFPELRKIIWIHGAEIQPWHRREYNFTTESLRAKAIHESDTRLEFWRGLLNPMAPNTNFVFVSKHFAEEVFEDVGMRIDPDRYSIIHNPIDTELFSYVEKSKGQRKKILSIRPFASRKYANDLSVDAILKLSSHPSFSELEFRIIGDGVLFDETVEPLRGLKNVVLERRFLSHSEIAQTQKEYGVFLVPTRWDSQGVSRDEAMSSGLVPITNSTAAIPEFVDESCGILVPPDDADGLALGIQYLLENPAEFERLSVAAARRVRSQSSALATIDAEIRLFDPC